jgi:hypothetical protein
LEWRPCSEAEWLKAMGDAGLVLTYSQMSGTLAGGSFMLRLEITKRCVYDDGKEHRKEIILHKRK